MKEPAWAKIMAKNRALTVARSTGGCGFRGFIPGFGCLQLYYRDNHCSGWRERVGPPEPLEICDHLAMGYVLIADFDRP